MKETPIFEEVFSRMLGSSGFWLKLLVGGLLAFVPVANFFTFGYLLRFSRSVRRTGQLSLPDWDDWSGLFTEGLKFALVWLAYWLLPVLLALALAAVIRLAGLGAFSYLVVSLVVLLTPILFGAALYRYNQRGRLKDLLDFPLIVRMGYAAFSRLMLPALTLAGIFAVAAPLYGFAFFFGFMVMIAQSSLCFRSMEQQRRVSL